MFLPISMKDLKNQNIDQPDFLLVTGDAYVDHPSFGHAIISRVLQNAGYSVAIIAQPKWHDTAEFKKLGRPRLGVMVASGNIDSMVAHYTAAKRLRSEDAYSPGGEAGHRPDRAVIVYCNRIREAFGDIPLIIGGIEASLRRFAHYDYWDNKVRRSIMFDSRADLLVYGMGERAVVDIANALNDGVPVKQIRDVTGTCYLANSDDAPAGVPVASYEDVRDDKAKYASACRTQYIQQDPIRGKTVIQPHSDRRLVQNPPAMPLNQKELDAIYALPYERTYHPSYEDMGGIPAIAEVKFSLASCRGCFGNCNFCSLTFHQGRIVQSRSHQSLLQEAEKISWDPEFKGYIHDVGGPTANFREPACKDQLTRGACSNKQCLYPAPCSNMKADHSDYLQLLRKLRQLPRIKKVFIRSGLRFDYMMADKSDAFINELCEHHVSGQLKVAPEHVSANVLRHMGKPTAQVYKQFTDKFKRINERLGKKQYIVPYLMSSHPGSTLDDAIELALYLRDNGINPQQVQDFYPTPGTVSTAMFYTGINPLTGKEVYVPRAGQEKAMQRALLQYKNPMNHALVIKALTTAGREDLIGYTKNCLVRPASQRSKNSAKPSGSGGKPASKILSKSNSNRSKTSKSNIEGGNKYGNNSGRQGGSKKGKGWAKAGGGKA